MYVPTYLITHIDTGTYDSRQIYADLFYPI